MPTKTTSATERAQAMYSQYTEGATLQQIGDQHGITRQRVQQIFEYHIVDYRNRVKRSQSRAHREAVETAQKKQAILDFIREYRAKNEISPTYQTIAEAITGSRNNAGNVSRWIYELIDEGFLYKVPTVANSLMLSRPQPREFYYRQEVTE